MRSPNVKNDYTLRIQVSVPEAAYSLNISTSTFYRRQKIEGFPQILTSEGRSTVRIRDLEHWSQNGSGGRNEL